MRGPVSRWLIRSQFTATPFVGADKETAVVADIDKAIDRLRRHAPLHVKLGLAVLELAFGMALVLLLWPDPRSRCARSLLAAVRRLPGPAPLLVRFYGSVTGLASFEHPLVVSALALEPSEAHANRMREVRAETLGGGRAR
jgi:hypothetical protein